MPLGLCISFSWGCWGGDVRSASGDKRGGAGAGGRGGNVMLGGAAGGLVVAEARDFNGEST